ncbi:MAG TPA: hypothetical protein VFL47_13230, partial [Flavisolibacter sp.]|nr:hypothetical protein [Flavisolibacter sp.]
MKKVTFTLILSIILLPCYSQKTGTEIAFKTSEGKTYFGTITDVNSGQSKLYFTHCGFTIGLPNEQVSAMKEAKKKTCFNISNEVERLLKQEAADLLHQLFKS